MSLKRTISITEGERATKRARQVSVAARIKRASSVNMSRMSSVRISRRLQQTATVNGSLGWGSAYDTTIAPALSSCSFWQAGIIAYQPTLPNVSEFTNLYDQYRIRKVHVEVFCTASEHGISTPTIGLPILHVINDYNTVGSLAITDYEQYPDMKTYMLGMGKRIKWSFVPRTRGDVITDNNLTSSSAASHALEWIDTSSANISYLGTHFYVNPCGLTTNTNLFNMTVIVTYDLEFRMVK